MVAVIQAPLALKSMPPRLPSAAGAQSGETTARRT